MSSNRVKNILKELREEEKSIKEIVKKECIAPMKSHDKHRLRVVEETALKMINMVPHIDGCDWASKKLREKEIRKANRGTFFRRRKSEEEELVKSLLWEKI